MLLVDDDPIILDALMLLVSHVGHQVDTAQSGAEAIRNLEQTDFDLVLTDSRMPQMNGEELAQVIGY